MKNAHDAVGRAIYEAQPGTPEKSWAKMNGVEREPWLKAARAAAKSLAPERVAVPSGSDMLDTLVGMGYRKVAEVSHHLRRMADSVDNAADSLPQNPVGAARDIVHTVTWGVANLSIEQLFGLSTDIERARRDHKSQKGSVND